MENYWEAVYGKNPKEIPWEIETPPRELLLALDKGWIKGKVLDVGCGSGNYTIFLAKRGLDVTGVDISKTAIAKAKERLVDLPLKFIASDLISLSSKIGQFERCRTTFQNVNALAPHGN